MEDLLSVLRSVEDLARELEAAKNVCIYLIFSQGRKTENTPPTSPAFQAHFVELDQLFFGKAPEAAAAKPVEISVPAANNSSITPQQTKKRPKRLLTLDEDDDGEL